MKGSDREVGYSAAGMLDYMDKASDRGVGDIQLSRLNAAANIRDRIVAELEAWVRASAEALYAEWILQQRVKARAAALTIKP